MPCQVTFDNRFKEWFTENLEQISVTLSCVNRSAGSQTLFISMRPLCVGVNVVGSLYVMKMMMMKLKGVESVASSLIILTCHLSPSHNTTHEKDTLSLSCSSSELLIIFFYFLFRLLVRRLSSMKNSSKGDNKNAEENVDEGISSLAFLLGWDDAKLCCDDDEKSDVYSVVGCLLLSFASFGKELI